MRSSKVSLHSVWKAFDEATFGPKNTLNLRESLPTAADARHRAEAWLRERQISRASEVLVITGRGNQTPGGNFRRARAVGRMKVAPSLSLTPNQECKRMRRQLALLIPVVLVNPLSAQVMPGYSPQSAAIEHATESDVITHPTPASAAA